MNLIYTIAYGFHAYHQCVLMVKSFRELGGFTGDIVVFTDTNHEIEGATVRYEPSFGETFSIMGLRWDIGSTMDLSKYDYVAMIDTDVVAIKPVDDFFDGDPDCIRVAEEFPDGRIVTGHSPWSIYGIPFDSSTPVFNCGTVFGHSKTWNEFSSLMWSLIRKFRPEIPHPYQWIDQQILNHIQRHNLFNVKQLPENCVFMCRRMCGVSEQTKIVHCLPGGTEKVQVMQLAYSLCKK